MYVRMYVCMYLYIYIYVHTKYTSIYTYTDYRVSSAPNLQFNESFNLSSNYGFGPRIRCRNALGRKLLVMRGRQCVEFRVQGCRVQGLESWDFRFIVLGCWSRAYT